jgi:hypothetical protein
MDLYGTGASVGQSNSLSAEVRNANLGVESVNSDLAEKLDNARQEETQTSLENQAINMYKGGQSLTSFVSNPQVQASASRLKSRGVQAAGKFLPVSGAERFARAGLEGADQGAVEATEQVTADISDATGATTAGERALASGGEAAGDVARGINTAGDVARGITTSVDIVKTGAKEALGTFARGTAAGLGGALDIYKDVKRGNFGSNWEQQVGNVGNIVGSGLELLGLATAWTGPLGIGLEALGAGVALGSTALETAGDIKQGDEVAEKTTDDIEGEKQAAVSSQTIEKAVGRAES